MRIDAEQLLRDTDIVQVVERYVPLKKSGTEHKGICPFHDDKKSSLQVSQSKQIYKCFACGAGGDSIDFLTRMGRTFHEACEEINGGIMPEGTNPEQRQAAPPKPNSWQQRVPPCPFDGAINHYRHGYPSKVWAYHLEDGRVYGYVCRFDMPDGEKQVLPYVWATDGNRSEWRWMGFSKPRPLYNYHLIQQHQNASILIVEGEKTADAAQAQLEPSKTVVTTWIGGARAIAHTDWMPLKERKIILWPDNDKPGRDAMQEVNLKVDASVRKWVNVPADLPEKWDAADKEWTEGELRKFILENLTDVPVREPEPAPEPKLKKPKPEGPKNPPLPPAPVKPQDTVIDDNPYYRMLGYDKDENSRLAYFFFSFDAKAVIKLTPSSMTKQNLIMLAPLNHWEMKFPNSGKSKIDMDAAAQYLIFNSHKVGIFKESVIRGRGAWVDDGRFILHTGDMLVVDREMMPLKEFRSKFVYEIDEHLNYGMSNPLITKDARKLIDSLSWLAWEREINAYLLAGWCVIAPFCGVLNWRPHAWLTGPSGSGKSWVLDNVVKRLVGNIALFVQGVTTEPGIRGMLRGDARPVVFDESDVDNNNDRDRIQSIVAAARASSYADGGVVAKGTQSGGSRSYTMRSCFFFASIGVQLSQMSDRSRFTILGLSSHEGKRDKDEFEKFTRDWHTFVTDEFIERLQSRTLSLLPVIIKNTRTFADAVAAVIGQRRIGDQVGGMLAGAYSLSSNKEITLEEAIKWVESKDWNEEKALEATKDEHQLFNKIMGHITFVEGQFGRIERTIGELVLTASNQRTELGVSGEVARDRLKRLGFLVVDGRVIVANNADGVKNIIKDTSWSSNHNKILERLEGAEKVDARTFSSGVKSRGVSIPIDMVEQSYDEGYKFEPFGATPDDDPF